MEPQFIHLNVHSEYALVDSVVRVKSLPEAVSAKNMPAVAITDPCNLFALVKFYRVALEAGIKPIIGAELFLENPERKDQPFRVTFLCQDKVGYKNLTYLITKSYTQGQRHESLPLIKKKWLVGYTQSLIALSGARRGDVGQALLAGKVTQARKYLEEWMELFPKRYYLELQRTGHPQEESYIQSVLVLATEWNLPVVATNAVCFLSKEDFEAHETRVCIYQSWTLADESRTRDYTDQQYLRSPQEMQALFSDIPEALTNTVEIAKRCNFKLRLNEIFLPKFPVPKELSVEDYLAEQSRKRLNHYLKELNELNTQQHQYYQDRLQLELDVINSMGFAGYFLIVADFIQWAKDNDIPVGPGRGSGAGSLVAYSLGITDLDPIQHDLLFERFLNPERVSMPDFDIDFCMEGRDKVIEYVMEKYGRNSVSQIVTYGSMAARAVVRDVGRVLGHPYGYVDKLAKLIPFEIGMTLKRALQQEDQLLERYQEEEEVRNLINLAIKLEGLPRNVSKHAGGVVIAPSDLIEFVPLYCEEGAGYFATQFDKDDVESIGLVKFDFLGLRTLTIINWTLQAINANRKPLVDIRRIPHDDPKTFKLLKSCKTTAVFQLESRGMKDLIKRLQPDCFDDIVALVALFRPGPLQSGMVDDFIDRKHGRARVEYLHPKLTTILRPTYGVILYQEQVMQIAQVLAGYTLGGADLLRRAMGKKKAEEMAKHRALFVDGAQKNGVDPHLANQIFDLMEKFAGYGFNKSHSTAYALIAYQTAWLKAHYPAEFMAAVLSSDMDNTDKVVRFIEDCKLLDLEVMPPDVNRSFYKFTVAKEGHILYGLGAIKGVGESAIENIIQVREQGGFKDLFEFCQRVDVRKINRKVLEALIRSGSMDSFGLHRAGLMAAMNAALQAAEQQNHNEECGQNDLFGGPIVRSTNVEAIKNYKTVTEWSDEIRLAGEKETLGIYFSGHPIENYQEELAKLVTSRIVELKASQDETVLIAGYIGTMRTMLTKKGNKMAFILLDDGSGRIEVAVFADLYEEVRDLLQKGKLLVIEGNVSIDDYTGGYRMRASKLYSLDQARESFAKYLLIQLDGQTMSQESIDKLTNILIPYRGGACPVKISYRLDDANAEIALGEEWKIRPVEQLLESLTKGNELAKVSLQY